MLIPHPWDYQEISDLPHFADGAVWESETKVVNFHFLTLKDSHLCPDPWIFFLSKVFYIVLWWSFRRRIVLSPENLSQQLKSKFDFLMFLRAHNYGRHYGHMNFFQKFSSTPGVVSVYEKISCDLNGTWEKKLSKLQDQ